MSNEFMMLRRKYADGNTSWRLVKYCDRWQAESRRLETRPGKYRKKDLYCIIPTEGVSDIPKHVLWLGIAVSANQIKGFTNFPSSPDNWLIIYEANDSWASVMVNALSFMPKQVHIKIGCESIRRSSEYGGKLIEEAVDACDAWSKGLIDAKALSPFEKSISTPHSLLAENVCRLCRVIPMNISASDALRATVEALANIEVVASQQAGAWAEKNIELGHVMRAYAPLADVMYSLSCPVESIEWE